MFLWFNTLQSSLPTFYIYIYIYWENIFSKLWICWCFCYVFIPSVLFLVCYIMCPYCVDWNFGGYPWMANKFVPSYYLAISGLKVLYPVPMWVLVGLKCWKNLNIFCFQQIKMWSNHSQNDWNWPKVLLGKKSFLKKLTIFIFWNEKNGTDSC